MVKLYFLFSLVLIISLSSISAELFPTTQIGVDIGFGKGTGQTGVNIFIPEEQLNVSAANVNSSDFTFSWITNQGIFTDVEASQIENVANTLTINTTWLDSLYCQLTGCTMQGDIDLGNNNLDNVNNLTINETICLDEDCEHFIKRNTPGSSQIFNGIADDAIWMHHTEMKSEGDLAFLLTHENNTLLWLQVGRNNSISSPGNSFFGTPNYMVDENFTNPDGTKNMTLASDYLNLCSTFGVDCRYTADTLGGAFNDVPGTPLLGTMGDLEIWKSAFIHEGLGVQKEVDFNLFGKKFTVSNGTARFTIPEIKEFGFEAGANVTVLSADFEGLTLTPFVQTSGGGAVDWTSVNNVLCHSEDCAQALGGAGSPLRIMEANISTLDLNNLNLSFWVTTNQASPDNFTVDVNNNTGSGNVTVFSSSATISDTQQSVILPTEMENATVVTVIFTFKGNNPAADSAYVDDVFVIGNATVATIANQSVEDGRIEFGDGECFIHLSVEDGFNDLNISCDRINLIGNTTQTSVTEVELNITENITIGDTLFTDNIDSLSGNGINIQDDVDLGNNDLEVQAINAMGAIITTANLISIGSDSTSADSSIQFRGVNNDGTIKWDEEPGEFVFDSTINTDGNPFNSTGSIIGGGSGHDQFSDFVANEHIDWTNSINDFDTSGDVEATDINPTNDINMDSDGNVVWPTGSGGGGINLKLHRVHASTGNQMNIDYTGVLQIKDLNTNDYLNFNENTITPSTGAMTLDGSINVLGGGASSITRVQATAGKSRVLNVLKDTGVLTNEGRAVEIRGRLEDDTNGQYNIFRIGGVSGSTYSDGTFFIETTKSGNFVEQITIDSEGDTRLVKDNQNLIFGAGNDTYFYWDSADFNINSTAGNVLFKNNSGWGEIEYGNAIDHTANETSENPLENFVKGGSTYEPCLRPKNYTDYSRPENIMFEVEICEKEKEEFIYQNCSFVFDGEYYQEECQNITGMRNKLNCSDIEVFSPIYEDIFIFSNETNTKEYSHTNLIGYEKQIIEKCVELDEVCRMEEIMEVTYPHKIEMNGTDTTCRSADIVGALTDINQNMDLQENLTIFKTSTLAKHYVTNTTKEPETLNKIENFYNNLKTKTYQEMKDMVLTPQGKLSDNILFNYEISNFGSYNLEAISHTNRAMNILMLWKIANIEDKQKQQLDCWDLTTQQEIISCMREI